MVDVLTGEKILERLAALSSQIEAHEAAIWLLEQQRGDLRMKLCASGWKPPEIAP